MALELPGLLTHQIGSRAPDPDILLVLVPVLIALSFMTVAAIRLLSRRGLLPPLDETLPAVTVLTVIVAALAIGAGAIQNAAIGASFAHDPEVGAAFVAMAVFQLGWGVLHLAVPSVGLAIVGLLTGDAILVAWVWSRTLGLPFGEEPWVPAPVGFPDTLASAVEVLIIVLLAARLAPQLRSRLVQPVRLGDAAVVATVVILSVVLVTGVAVTSYGVRS